MCRSMVDIESPAAEIRRGKKEEEERRKKEGRKKLQDENIMVALLHRATIKSIKTAATNSSFMYGSNLHLVWQSMHNDNTQQLTESSKCKRKVNAGFT